MQIRRLHEGDVDAYRALRLRSFHEHPEAFTTSFEELQAQSVAETRKRLAAPNVKLWGAFEDTVLCGHVGLDRETRAKSRHKATLVGMYVAPEHTGRGIGRLLVETVIREARNDGIELVVLTVTEGNSQAAKLYERCGFRSFGVEPHAIKVNGRAYGKNHMYLEIAP